VVWTSRSVGAENLEPRGSEERRKARLSGTPSGLRHVVPRTTARESPREFVAISLVRKQMYYVAGCSNTPGHVVHLACPSVCLFAPYGLLTQKQKGIEKPNNGRQIVVPYNIFWFCTITQ